MPASARIFMRIGGWFRALRHVFHARCANTRAAVEPPRTWGWPPISTDWTAPVPLGRNLKDSMQIYDAFRDYVKHEDNLVNHRMTWVFTIHGFLYATYGFSLQKKVEIDNGITGKLVEKLGVINCGKATILADHDHVMEYLTIGRVGLSVLEVDLFLVAITLLGICLSYYGQRSIVAAADATEAIRDQFHRQFRRSMIEEDRNGIRVTLFCIQADPLLCLPSITGGGTSRANARGFTVARNMPRAMMWGWLAALAYLGVGFIANWPMYSRILEPLLASLKMRFPILGAILP